MRSRLNYLLGLGVAIFPSLVLANLELYEPFDYPITTDPTTDSLIGQTNIGANQSWALTGSVDGGAGPSIVQGDATDNINSLSVPGLMPSVGNALMLSSTPAANANTAAPRIGFVNGDTFSKVTGTAGPTLYYSLMLRVDPTSSDVGNNAASPPGTWLAGFNNNTGTQTTGANSGELSGVLAGLTMHLDAAAGNDTYSLGLTANVTSTRTFDDAKPLSKGSTVFVVASYAFSASGADVANLWINPDIGSFGASAPTTAPDYTLDATSAANPVRISSFFVRENQYDPNLMTLDEVRVGTTWADVTPRDPSLITGDANLDGVLDYKDLDALTNGLNNNLTGWANGDFNGDGVINADDVSLFQYNFALYGTNTTPAPEPSAALLGVFALAPMALRRRSRAMQSR